MPDSKQRNGETLEENRIALTTEQLADATYDHQKKRFSTKQILENYIDPLVNQGYIDKCDSELDKRSRIFYPVTASKIRKLFDSDQSNNLLQECCVLVKNPSLYPDKHYINSKIRQVLEYSTQDGNNKVEKIVNHENKEISIEQVAEIYYGNPQEYFGLTPNSDTEKKGASPTNI